MIEIHNSSCFDLSVDDLSLFDCMITDPPYSPHVHESAVSQSAGRGTRKRDLGFESLSHQARHFVGLAAASVKRWSVVYSDWESFNWLALRAQACGAEYIRTIPWVRWSMPQLSGDRPPQGSEAVVVMHAQHTGARGGRKPMHKGWNGPGNLTHLDELCLRGEGKHKTEKPLDQALRLVSYFSDPGDMVLDAFAGSGTVALACCILGRDCVSFEIDPQWARRAAMRCANADLAVPGISGRDAERIRRWLLRSDEPIATQEEGPSLRRRAARYEDRKRAGDFLRRAGCFK